MRLIRSVYRPTNVGLSRRFERCQYTKISSARLHPVSNETSNLVYGLNILGIDRFYAASASSSMLEDRKPQRRVSKNERKTMVENYVNKYRETNDGEFPSVSDTKKDVGGNYYVVRQIVQEMIYSSKQSSVNSKDTSFEKSATKRNEMTYNSSNSEYTKDVYLEKKTVEDPEMECDSKEQSMCTETSLVKSATKGCDISTKFKEVLQTMDLGESTKPILKDIENSSSMLYQSKRGQQSSVSVETDEPKVGGALYHHPVDELQSSRNLDYEKDVKLEILEGHVKSNASEREIGPQESMEISGRGLQEVPSADAESKRKPSVWNNLKSFANGILSIWKRS